MIGYIVLYGVWTILQIVGIGLGLLWGKTLGCLFFNISGILVGGGMVIVLVTLLDSPPQIWMETFLTRTMAFGTALQVAGILIHIRRCNNTKAAR